MSFSYNPYRHFDIIKVDVGMYQAVCHGCGGRIGSLFDQGTPIGVFEGNIAQHLLNSHGRAASDFEGWPDA